MNELLTALIATVVSVVGTIVTIYSSKGNLRARSLEFEQRQIEFRSNFLNK